MALLSNILRPENAPPPRFTCRPVRAAEVAEAVRLVLAGPRGAADDEHVSHFLRFAEANDLNLSDVWVAAREPGDRVVWAILPVVSPGRTALLSLPGRLPRPTDRPAAISLITAVCGHLRAAGVELAQSLLDPESRDVAGTMAAAGFSTLADLVYLRREASAGAVPTVGLPAGGELVPFDESLADRFSAVILESYEQSLDCPALNGRRGMGDVLEGHRAAGEFAPDLWSLLTVGGRDAGVLLLNRLAGGEGLELVYTGLAPWARGRGWADALIRLALHHAADEPGRRIVLAVDGQNAPALRLYHRHGFRDLHRKVAWMNDLREPAAEVT